MKSIASYYIETTCLNKLTETDMISIEIDIDRISLTYFFFKVI